MAADSAPMDAAMAQLVWRGLPQLLAVLDTSGRLHATNPAWQHVLGWGAQQLLGRPVLAFVHAEDQATAWQWLGRVIGGAGPASFSGRWRCANGSHLRLHWTLALRDGLACAIGQQTLAADPAPDAAVALQVRQQTLRSLARLSSGMSHDLNNLLQVLRNTLELIQQRPWEPRQVAGWARSALRTVGPRCTAHPVTAVLCGQPAAVPADGAGGQLAARPAWPVADCARLPQQVAAASAGGWGALTTGDPGQLEQAVLNLALNAVDAMPQGGQLTITLGHVQLEQDLELATGNYVTIDVRDSGGGMSAPVRDHAFEPFFTTKPLGSGSGLGLSQVYGVLQQLGGAVRLLGLPADPLGADALARRACRLRPDVRVVRLDALATAAHAALDINALAQAVDRAAAGLQPRGGSAAPALHPVGSLCRKNCVHAFHMMGCRTSICARARRRWMTRGHGATPGMGVASTPLGGPPGRGGPVIVTDPGDAVVDGLSH